MTEWLVAEYSVLGVHTQNWMWLVAGAFLLYALVVALTRRRRPLA